MVSKDKVLNAIEELLKGKSATKNFKENIAAIYAEQIEDEDGIDDFIKNQESFLNAACSEADRRVVAAKANEKKEETKTTETKVEETKTNEGASEFEKLAKLIEGISEKVNSFEATNKAKTIQEKFFSHKNVKGVNLPESVKAKYVPASEDDFDTAISSFETDFKPLIEANALSAYGNDKPGSSTAGGRNVTVKEASDAEVDDFINNNFKK